MIYIHTIGETAYFYILRESVILSLWCFTLSNRFEIFNPYGLFRADYTPMNLPYKGADIPPFQLSMIIFKIITIIYNKNGRSTQKILSET